ncbi:MAG: multicopper oxidase domain-containing protein [Dehalococcoidia bacterium]|nr:multicopper oxidase domain-containing protein [Dehalococcoidia bacterium]
MSRRLQIIGAALLATVFLASLLAGTVLAAQPPAPAQTQLPGNKIPQFVDPLPVLDLNAQSISGISTVIPGSSELVLNMQTFQGNIMPSVGWAPANGLPYTGTWTFGYLVDTPTGSLQPLYETPVGPVIVAVRGTPTQIRYVNNLEASDATIRWRDWTDQSLHSAFHQAVNMSMPPMLPDPMVNMHYMGPVLAVPHLHGGEVPAAIDGGPEAWFASDVPGPDTTTTYITHGPAYYTHPNVTALDNEAVYRYPNSQEAGPLWFHDHLLGGTRLMATYGGLAGAYDLIDLNLTLPAGMNAVGLNNGNLNLTSILGPGTKNENVELLIPLVIQDRMFDTNGQLFFPVGGGNPEHPYWVPEFVGDTIIVNGKVWPYLNVDQKRYRFFIIDGSNARAYDMFLQDLVTGIKYPMWVISTDGGYLDTPVKIDPNATGAQVKAGAQKSLKMMPGERYEVIVDFAGIPAGTNLVLRNTAPTVNGNPKARTEGRIMQFRVTANAPVDNSYNPALGGSIRTGGQTIQRLVNPATGTMNPVAPVNLTRELTLNEVMGAVVPLEALVNNSKWGGHRPDMSPIPNSILVNGNWLTELPNEGAFEIWEIINLTPDSHPIHLHAVQFQILNRQFINLAGYTAAYNGAFVNTPGIIDPMTGLPYPNGVYIPGFGPPLPYSPGDPGYNSALQGGKYGGNPDVANYLVGAVMPPLPYEAGWKDTAIMRPGEVTRIAVRFAPQDLAPSTTDGSFTFNPAAPINPGAATEIPSVYVWHCHITDHEDNEMMRPDMIIPNLPDASRTYVQVADY